MDTKLTLSVDSQLVEKAKSYARSRGRSLSDLVEMYLKALTQRRDTSADDLTPKVRNLLGSYTVPLEFDHKQELRDQLEKKYL